jgi:ankyrin repeat protein
MACDQDLATPLHLAAASGRHGAILLIVTRLLDINQHSVRTVIDTKDRLGRTPLHYAAAFNQPQAFGILLQYEASITAVDSNGWSVAHHAARYAHIAIASTCDTCTDTRNDWQFCGNRYLAICTSASA